MFFKDIVKNFSNNIYDYEIYRKVIDDYAESLACKGIHCNNLGATKKLIAFFIEEHNKKRKVEIINKEFWMSIFHDIKNPMIGIDFALRGIDGRDNSSGVLKDIYNLNQANLEFIRMILENYHFEEGFFEKKHENINLKKLLNTLLRDYKYILKERRLKVNLNAVDKDIMLYSCPISISRVFSNLITNAARFASKGSEIAFVGETLEDDINWVFVSIENYGEKIADLEGIFEKFISSSGSNGLGLHICKKIVNDAGGKIWAENLNDGVKFCMLLKA